MKGPYKILSMSVALLFCALPLAFSQQAIIQELTGTVELQAPGSTGWENAQQGQSISGDTIISTGFRSSALIRAGSALITVRPLTRLSLTEIQASANTETLNVNLQSGRVRVDVNPPTGTRANMSITAPTATASVRGTSFEFDTMNLVVREGTVEFSGASNAAVLVQAGSSSFADESTGRAAPPAETVMAALRPELPVASDYAAALPQPTAPQSGLTLTAIIEFLP